MNKICPQMMKKLNEKDAQIDELQRQMRYQEHQFKKRDIEMQNELQYEQKRSETLTQQLNEFKQSGNMKIMAEALESRLTEYENKLIEVQESEKKLRKELLQVEKENLELKQEIKTILKENRNSYNTPAKPLNNVDNQQQSPLVNPFNQRINTDIKPIQEEQDDNEKQELMQKIQQIQQEKDELEAQFNDIKQGAIETIVEKQKVIDQLQESLELQQYQIEQLQAFQKNIPNDYQAEEIQQQLEKLAYEYQNYKEEMEREYLTLQEQHQHLIVKYDQDMMENEQKMYKLEQDYNLKHYQRLQNEMDSAKMIETDLLSQLKSVENKYLQSEKSYHESIRIYESFKEERHREQQKLERKIEELQKKMEKFDEQTQLNKSLQKQLEEQEKKFTQSLNEKTQQLEKSNQKRDETNKHVINIEQEKKQLVESLERLKQKNHELEDKIFNLNIDYEAKIEQLKQDNQLEVQNLKNELNKGKETVDDSLQNELEQLNDNDYAFGANDDEDDDNTGGSASGSQQQLEGTKNEHSKIERTPENVNHKDLEEENSLKTPTRIEENGTQANQSNNHHNQTTTQSALNNFTTSNNSNSNYYSTHSSGGGKKRNFEFDVLRSPRSAIKLMFNDYQKEIKHLKDERRKNEERIDELEYESNELQIRINRLENTNEELQKEIEKSQQEIKQLIVERQQQRKNFMNSPGNAQNLELLNDLEQTKQHLKKMETHLLTSKLQYVEDNSFLSEELAREKSKNKELQEEYNKVVQEKTYFMMKIKRSSKKDKEDGLFKKFTVLR